jgi:protein phosphatase 2C family protein 2/3
MDIDPRGIKDTKRGRIILLGDGSEVLTDSNDVEMFDHSEEDQDLESQVHKSEPAAKDEKTAVPEKLVLPDKALPKSGASKEGTTETEST